MSNNSIVVRSVEGNHLEVNNDGSINTSILNTLITTEYDEINLTYVSAGNGVGEIETVTYKKDSITVSVLTLGYDGNNKLASVARS